MIEKIIHFIWFGKNPMSELSQKCIESWKKYCPDYQIMEWNENNFDLNMFPYAKEAYENKGWAFVSDVVRLYALYTYGGIYMDTDVELLKPLDPFLIHKGFSGFETKDTIQTGIIGAEKGNPLIGAVLKDYEGRRYLKANGKPDYTPITSAMTRISEDMGLELNNTYQEISDFVFYPIDYFCPKDYRTLELKVTDNTVCIHHFNGAWGNIRLKKFKRIIKRILGNRLTIFITERRHKRRRKKEEKNRQNMVHSTEETNDVGETMSDNSAFKDGKNDFH